MPRARFLPALLACALVLTVPSPASAQAAERITSYNVDIRIERNGALAIVEDITYDFGRDERHGIERDIRTKLRYDDRYDREYRLEAVKVSGARNTPAEHTTEDIAGGITRLRIGDPDRTISGQHTYRIEYRLEGALNAFDDHDELYWNAIGTEWRAPIGAARVTVGFASTDPPGEIDTACFAGPVGSSLACDTAQADGPRATFAHANLDAYEGMTVVVGFPKGRVPSPAPLLVERWTFQRAFTVDPLRLALTGGVLAAVVFGLARLVWLRGRDWRWRGAPVDVVFGGASGEQRVPLFEGGAYAIEYTPVDDLRPGQIGTLMDEVAHPLDVSATIIDLATRGYLKIEEIPKEGWFGKPDWKLIRQHEEIRDKRALLEYEQLLLDALFESGDDVTLSSLKTKFHAHLAKVQDALYADAVERGWFTASPDDTRQRWIAAGIAALVVAALLVFAAARWTTFGLVPTPLVLGGLGLLMVHQRMPRRTAKGTAALRRTLGFRQFIDTAETRRAEFAEKAGLFYEYLPFAVVFGSVDRWAKAFEGLAMPNASWYASSRPFTMMAFADSLDGFSTTTSGTIVSTPGGSGSSGFSGGSSGGGGGGGGGGSW